MLIKTVFSSAEEPFEGNKVWWLTTLPAGAIIRRTAVTVRPVKGKTQKDLFLEDITLRDGRGDWGVTGIKGSVPTDRWLEVDFHARRTLHSVTGQALVSDCDLQVDLGGLFVNIAADGSVLVPGDTAMKINLNPDLESLLPGLTVSRFRLRNPAIFPELQKLTIRNTPTNVNLSFNFQSPFWLGSGELSKSINIPDFSEALNNYLLEAEVKDGFYQIPFVLHSDSIARLEIELEIEYHRETRLLPESLAEVHLPFDYSSMPNQQAGLLKAVLPANARVIEGRTGGRVQGAFAESRVVFGPTGTSSARFPVPVNPGLSQAHYLKVDQEITAGAVDLLLAAVTRRVKLDVNLLPDSDGKPFDDPLLSRPIKVELDRDSAGSLTWISVPLDREFLFKPDEAYWLVVQALEGEAVWGADLLSSADGLPVQSSDNGGMAWRKTVSDHQESGLAALVRLRYTPDRFQMPVELLVGEGQAARRLSLERFQPLGRVDFNLDFDEVGQTINRYLDDITAGDYTDAEHLENGEFDDWFYPNKMVRKLNEFSYERVELMALSPDNIRLFSVGPGPETGSTLRMRELFCGDQSLEIEQNTVKALSINQKKSRLYIVSGVTYLKKKLSYLAAMLLEPDESYVQIIDTSSGLTDLGNLQVVTMSEDGYPLNWVAQDIKYHYRQNLVYLAAYPKEYKTETSGKIWAIDAEKLELQVLQNNQLNPDDLAGAAMSLGSGCKPLKMELAPSERFLFVPAARHGRLVLHIIDTADNILLTRDGAHDLGPYNAEVAHRLSASSDDRGRYLAVLDVAIPQGETSAAKADQQQFPRSLYMVDREDASVTDLTGRTENLQLPLDVFLSNGGERIYLNCVSLVNNSITGSLISFDWQKTEEADELEIMTNLQSLPVSQITMDRQNLYVSARVIEGVEKKTYKMSTVQLDQRQAVAWQHVSGNSIQALYPGEENVSIILDHSFSARDTRDTQVAQVFPVQGGARYHWEFLGLACRPGALAELTWIGEACRQEAGRESMPIVAADEPEVVAGTGQRPHTPELHHLAVRAPAGAIQAEIRFTVPKENAAIIDHVSLKVPSAVLVNESFVSRQNRPPNGWVLRGQDGSELSREDARLVELQRTDNLFSVRNRNAFEVDLSQTGSIEGGKSYELMLNAWADEGAAGNGYPAIGLSWEAAEASVAESSLQIAIESRTKKSYARQLTAPAGATHVTVSLQIPAGAVLRIEDIRFRRTEMVEVPLSFVARAPGELVVSDVKLGYELRPADPPPVPEQGLCPPQPAAGAGECCCCPCCGERCRIVEPAPAETRTGRPAQFGRCSRCGCNLVQYGGRPTAGRAELRVGGDLSGRMKGKKPLKKATAGRVAGRGELNRLLDIFYVVTAGDRVSADTPELKKKVSADTGSKQKAARRDELIKKIKAAISDPSLLALKNFKLTTIVNNTAGTLAHRIGRK